MWGDGGGYLYVCVSMCSSCGGVWVGIYMFVCQCAVNVCACACECAEVRACAWGGWWVGLLSEMGGDKFFSTFPEDEA